MPPSVTLANAAAFGLPEDVVERMTRHLRLRVDAQKRIDPDSFVSSLGFHRVEVEGFHVVYELEPDGVTAYVVAAPRAKPATAQG